MLVNFIFETIRSEAFLTCMNVLKEESLTSIFVKVTYFEWLIVDKNPFVKSRFVAVILSIFIIWI